jgi:hypothetical protein
MNKKLFSVFVTSMMFLFLFSPELALSDIFQWTDDKGTLHFTEDESAVPEQYRDQVRKIRTQEGPKSTSGTVSTKGQGRVTKTGEASRKEPINLNKTESDVIEAFRTIISLWKEGKYEALYEHGDKKTQIAIRREDFERGMKEKPVGLASSWETIKDIRVEVESPTRVRTTAKIGYKFKKGGDTKHRTETYLMTLEKGSWKIDLQKILRAKF